MCSLRYNVDEAFIDNASWWVAVRPERPRLMSYERTTRNSRLDVGVDTCPRFKAYPHLIARICTINRSTQMLHYTENAEFANGLMCLHDIQLAIFISAHDY